MANSGNKKKKREKKKGQQQQHVDGAVAEQGSDTAPDNLGNHPLVNNPQNPVGVFKSPSHPFNLRDQNTQSPPTPLTSKAQPTPPESGSSWSSQVLKPQQDSITKNNDSPVSKSNQANSFIFSPPTPPSNTKYSPFANNRRESPHRPSPASSGGTRQASPSQVLTPPRLSGTPKRTTPVPPTPLPNGVGGVSTDLPNLASSSASPSHPQASSSSSSSFAAAAAIVGKKPTIED